MDEFHPAHIPEPAEAPPDTPPSHDAIIAEIVDRSRRAVSSNLPMFIIVQYSRDSDKVAFLDALRGALTRTGLHVREFDPVHDPKHGTGKLYPLMADASAENAVCLIFGLPREAGEIRADHDFIHYLNIHRDSIITRRIRMILMLREREMEQFIFSAGDLWDFRQVTFRLERPVSADASWAWDRMETQTTELPVSEAESGEIRNHIQNVRALVERTEDPSEKAVLLLRLCQWLSRRNAYKSSAEAALNGLELLEGEPSKTRAELEYQAGYSLYKLNEFIDANEHLKTALDLYNAIADETRTRDLEGEADTLQALGDLRMRVDDLDGARDAYETALPIYREIKERLGEANTLQALGDLRMRVDDLDGARDAYETALPIYREIKARLGEANTLQALGDYFRAREEYSAAISNLNEALTIHLEIQNFLGICADFGYLVRTLNNKEDFPTAVIVSEVAFFIFRIIKDSWGQALILNDQGTAFQGMENRDGEIAAKWLSHHIFKQIKSTGPTAQRVARFFQHLGETMEAEEYHALVEELKQNAEAIRRRAVLAVWETRQNDPLVRDILARMPAQFTQCFS